MISLSKKTNNKVAGVRLTFILIFFSALLSCKSNCYAFNKSDTLTGTLITKDTNGTFVKLYFTDGNGKFYKNNIDVLFENVETKQLIKLVERKVDANGNPIAVQINFDGKVIIKLHNTLGLLVNNIIIQKNKINNIAVKVPKGSLIFTYQSNRNKPVLHKATVIKKYDANTAPPLIISTKDKTELDPGEYLIEMDMLPKFALSTKVNFGEITEVQVPQEGQITIDFTKKIADVTLLYRNGDALTKFYVIKTNGDRELKQLLLKPGTYQASYKDTDATGKTINSIINFKIVANKQTIIELKDYGTTIAEPAADSKPLFIN
jgi:hypothetical protein